MTVAQADRAAATASASLDEAADGIWDALVVGAGPAGAAAAHEIARLGSRVLLVDRAPFPRWKVCGCCLNGAALDVLEKMELGHLTHRLGARPLRRWRLCSRAGQAVCDLPIGASLSRAAFDAALAQAAVEQGACFLDETNAALRQSDGAYRSLILSQGSQRMPVRARVLIVADGLAGRLLDGEAEFRTAIRPSARLGAGTVLEADAGDYENGTIYMACGRGGYVGLVRLEDGRCEVAAALDRRAVRQAGRPAAAAVDIFRQARLPVPRGIADATWRGTPPLTRQRAQVAGHRTFVVGDAAGYIEPFTGEGIAWALATGRAVAPLAVEAAQRWSDEFIPSWTNTHREIVSRRQRTCRLIGRMLRTPLLTDVAVWMLSYAPWLAQPIMRALNRPLDEARHFSSLRKASAA